jgi:hypothetical protein
MINWLESTAYAATLYSGATTTYAAADRVPEPMRNFLARLRLLYGVPFNYLVPDSRLLPVESIRFFYIDRNFTDRLVDGALSVGKTTTREFLHAQQMNPDVRQRVDDEERVLRRQLRGDSIGTITAPKAADLTGLLLRSRAVSGWPGLEVKAYRGVAPGAEPARGAQLPLLRMDRLAPDVLFCIFEGIPSRVDIEEPREGIQFGVDLNDRDGDGVVEGDATTPSGFRLKLKNLRGADAGKEILNGARLPKTIAVPVRKSNRRVLHMDALRTLLTTSLRAEIPAHPNADPGAELTAGEMALELFQFPFRQRFEQSGDPQHGGDRIFDAGSVYTHAAINVSVYAQPLTNAEITVLFPAANLR